MDDEIIQSILKTSVGMIHAIDLADLEAYIDRVSANNATYDTLGPILDPTAYREKLYSGQRDALRTELEIARKLLEIRKLVDGLGVRS